MFRLCRFCDIPQLVYTLSSNTDRLSECQPNEPTQKLFDNLVDQILIEKDDSSKMIIVTSFIELTNKYHFNSIIITNNIFSIFLLLSKRNRI